MKEQQLTTWVFNDGGRLEAGFKGRAGDCVTRAIAIVTGKSYLEVYNELNELCNSNLFRKVKGKSSARTGIPKRVYIKYLTDLGFTWTPLMSIGSGCRVHLKAEELPSGLIMARLSGHLCAVKDGVINDTYDCSRNGTRCVYGYWSKK